MSKRPNRDGMAAHVVSIGIDPTGSVVISFEDLNESMRMDHDSALQFACAIASAALVAGADVDILANFVNDNPPMPMPSARPDA